MTIQFRVIGLVPRLPTGTTAAVRGRFALPLNSSSRGFITLVSSSPTTSSILGRPSNKSQGCVLQIQGRSSNLGLRTAGRATLVSKSFFHSTTSSPPKPTPVIEPAESPAVRQGTTPPPGGKAVFPATLLIYHAGTAKTSFLAVLKLTTIFVFGFFCLIMTPIYLTAGKDYSYAALVFSCGTIPFLYVAWATSPFVAAIHMHLPPYARWSPAILQRFIRTAPPNTRIDIATMSLIGKPRVSSMTIGDLKPCKKRFGMVNYERDTKLLDKERSWWRFRAVRYFNVQQGNDEKIKTGWVWRELAERIEGEEEKNKGVKRSVAAGAGSGSVSGVGTKVTGKNEESISRRGFGIYEKGRNGRGEKKEKRRTL